MPESIRSDNGPEFIAKEIQEWIEQSAVETMCIEPGCPWQNPWVESFHSRLRDECLDRELFFSVKEAQLVLEDYRELYNTYRVHSGIDYKSPIEIFDPQGSGSGRATPVLHRCLPLPIIPCLT
jgi:transposase InsO family protein